MGEKAKGLSLVELLIVVVVLSILAAIAAPHVLQSKAAANEGSAIASVRSIISAEMTYFSAKGGGKYGSLEKLMDDQLVDNALGTGAKDGYIFAVPTGDAASNDFTVTAVPLAVGRTGSRGFFGDATGVVRYSSDGSVPTVSSPPLGQ